MFGKLFRPLGGAFLPFLPIFILVEVVFISKLVMLGFLTHHNDGCSNEDLIRKISGVIVMFH